VYVGIFAIVASQIVVMSLIIAQIVSSTVFAAVFHVKAVVLPDVRNLAFVMRYWTGV
jgi:hypothetical protein